MKSDAAQQYVRPTIERQNQVAVSLCGLKHRRMNATCVAEHARYPLPFRISLGHVLEIARQFQDGHRGKTRRLALWGALFDSIAEQFRIFSRVERGRFRRRGQHSMLAADLECLDESGSVILSLDLQAERATFRDVQATVIQARHREIRDVFFTAPKIDAVDTDQIKNRIATAFASGQNIYCADFFDLARAVLALGGEQMRVLFLRKVGEHLDKWNTQPSNRQAWKQLLESI